MDRSNVLIGSGVLVGLATIAYYFIAGKPVSSQPPATSARFAPIARQVFSNQTVTQTLSKETQDYIKAKKESELPGSTEDYRKTQRSMYEA